MVLVPAISLALGTTFLVRVGVKNRFETTCAGKYQGRVVESIGFDERATTSDACQITLVPGNPYLPGTLMYANWTGRLHPARDDEEDMLDELPLVYDTSRLSCQIIYSPELDGLSVELPSAA